MKNIGVLILLLISISCHARQEILSPFSKFDFSTIVNGETLEVHIESGGHQIIDYSERVYYTPDVVIILINGNETVIPKEDYDKFGGIDIGLIRVTTEVGNLIYIQFPVGVDPRNKLSFVFQDWEYKGTTTTIYDRVHKNNTKGVEWYRE